MKVINTLQNYATLDSVQSKYFFGYTGGDKPTEIATSKQLWKIQDISNKLYHYYLTIETVADGIKSQELQNQLVETKKAIDEMTAVSLPMSKENMNKKIKLLQQLLDSTLPKLSNLVQQTINEQTA